MGSEIKVLKKVYMPNPVVSSWFVVAVPLPTTYTTLGSSRIGSARLK